MGAATSPELPQSRKLQDSMGLSVPWRCRMFSVRHPVNCASNTWSIQSCWVEVFCFSDDNQDYHLWCHALGKSFYCLTPECCERWAQLGLYSHWWLCGTVNIGEFTYPKNLEPLIRKASQMCKDTKTSPVPRNIIKLLEVTK